jgi:hypothetical protein
MDDKAWSLKDVVVMPDGKQFLSRFTKGFSTSPRRLLAIAIISGVIAAALVLCGISLLYRKVLVRLHLHNDLSWYGLGLYGTAPSEHFESFHPPVPLLEFPQWDDRCSQDYIFFGWRGHDVEEPAAVIFDWNGELVWRQTGSAGDKDDVRPQVYKGEQFLTYYYAYDDPARGVTGADEEYYCWYMVRDQLILI